MKKAGILGGGQLGRMLLQAAANYPVETFVMENDADCPAAHLCHRFVKGDIQNFDDVYNFGKGLDVLTIEIETVNTEALEKLENSGVQVIPSAAVIKTIKNKIDQKKFYIRNEIPTAPFIVTESSADVQRHIHFLPAVHKLASGGYDGRGVQVLDSEKDLALAFDAPSVLEKKISIAKELSLIVAVGTDNGIAMYPPVEMVADPRLNLLLYQISPAELSNEVFWKAEAIAIRLAKAFRSAGIFAIEMMVDDRENVWVNETAPRVHNSGHHSIEANYSSQFDMLWRIMLGYPLGNPDTILGAGLVNLLGAEGFVGDAVYEGLGDVLAMENTFVHIYGKKTTKPGRKMGHVTILSRDMKDVLFNANKIRNLIKVRSDYKV